MSKAIAEHYTKLILDATAIHRVYQDPLQRLDQYGGINFKSLNGIFPRLLKPLGQAFNQALDQGIQCFDTWRS
ncbi:hypothetical protein TU80_11755 [Pseudomonas veronii]|nr:hypothetical protein TU80_11755 [Pseudomonas veronii]